ncbi:uncharacterized protein [Watersipora subatra]|uniref:uncharacterized protein n=1 Tax=Watersipora subatra TaxID=2589382 RepID=UPI00355B8256
MGERSVGQVVAVVVVILLVAAVSLICTSYSDLEFYQMGFTKSKTTGAVDTSKVWPGGRQWIGPVSTFKIFQASAHVITLDKVSVFAAPDQTSAVDSIGGSSGASLAIQISVHIVYFLIPQDLKLLHDKYDINYETLVRNSAQAAIKDSASKYTLQDFYENRQTVEEALLADVKERLGGICCTPGCNGDNPWSQCVKDCIDRTLCNDSDKGVFVDARYLQMTDLEIPTEVELRNLKTIIITEETAKEKFTQDAAVIQKETEQLVEDILNSAQEVTANATAQSQLIAANSQANYEKILEGARREGLVRLFTSVGLSTVDYKNSFDYLRSLADNSNAHLTVDFDQLITGPTKLP